MSFKKLIMGIFITTMLTGCSSLFMSVVDREEAAKSIILIPGDKISVLKPTMDSNLEIANRDEFASKIQTKMISGLQEREIKSEASDVKEGTYLIINISNYNKGCGFCRGFFPFFGLGNTYLDGTAILVTPKGKRELEISKVAHVSGMAAIKDQTENNIDYFTDSLASKITTSTDKN